jgi:hypothetical protein
MRSVHWPRIPDYAADGIFAESLFKTYGQPARITGRALAAIEFHNYGLPDALKEGKTQRQKALLFEGMKITRVDKK